VVTGFTPHDQHSLYSSLFLRSVPEGFLLDTPRLVRQAIQQAFKRDTELLPGARRDKFPIDRRALVETALFNLGSKYAADGMHAVERKNEGNNYSHIEIMCGKVVMIPAAVDSEREIVRDASYRRSLAEKPQLAFANMAESNEPLPENALLGVILYGPSSDYPRTIEQATPGFVIVRFPASDWSCYVEGRVDLLRRLVDHESARRTDAERDVQAREKEETV
jgi:hypothetical protein